MKIWVVYRNDLSALAPVLHVPTPLPVPRTPRFANNILSIPSPGSTTITSHTAFTTTSLTPQPHPPALPASIAPTGHYPSNLAGADCTTVTSSSQLLSSPCLTSGLSDTLISNCQHKETPIHSIIPPLNNALSHISHPPVVRPHPSSAPTLPHSPGQLAASGAPTQASISLKSAGETTCLVQETGAPQSTLWHNNSRQPVMTNQPGFAGTVSGPSLPAQVIQTPSHPVFAPIGALVSTPFNQRAASTSQLVYIVCVP